MKQKKITNTLFNCNKIYCKSQLNKTSRNIIKHSMEIYQNICLAVQVCFSYQYLNKFTANKNFPFLHT